jgi:hypothetical protein
VVEHAKTKNDIPNGELFYRAQMLELEIAGEEMRAKEAALREAECQTG